MLVPDRVTGALAYRKALKNQDINDFDGSDCCALSDTSSSLRAALADAATIHPEWTTARDAKVGEKVPFGGTVIAQIKGMGKVYDWRNTSWSQPNGGTIPLLLFVDHIPVIPNMPGIADFIRLRDVLYAQGLRVQTSTDSSGNVAFFTPFNRLCYQARGANSFSMGCEHMHYGINDPWTKHQLNASSYTHWYAREHYGLRVWPARLGAGNGIVRVYRRGQTEHKAVSHYAGYNDRSDPGPLYERDEERVRRGVLWFDKHRSFVGF